MYLKQKSLNELLNTSEIERLVTWKLRRLDNTFFFFFFLSLSFFFFFFFILSSSLSEEDEEEELSEDKELESCERKKYS